MNGRSTSVEFKRNLLIALITYIILSFLWIGFLSSDWTLILKILTTFSVWISLLIGGIVVVIFTWVFQTWRRKVVSFISILVPYSLISLGVIVIMLSRVTTLWVNPPWNPSVLGAGISVAALGIAFLALFYPSRPNEQRRNQENVPELTEGMAALSDRLNELEAVIDAVLEKFRRLDERLSELQEENRDEDSQNNQ